MFFTPDRAVSCFTLPSFPQVTVYLLNRKKTSIGKRLVICSVFFPFLSFPSRPFVYSRDAGQQEGVRGVSTYRVLDEQRRAHVRHLRHVLSEHHEVSGGGQDLARGRTGVRKRKHFHLSFN